MWEAIESNRRRSWILLAGMGLLLVVLGFVLGAALSADFAGVGRGVDQFRSYVDTIDEYSGAPHASRGRFFDWIQHPSLLINTGGLIGIAVALAVWTTLTQLALIHGDAMLLRTARAIPIQKADAPQLWNVVEEMTIASGLQKMPAIYLVDNDAPNAFAVGRRPETAAVAVTSGLLKRLNRDELQGVIAHEIGHIANQDTRFLTLASVLLGSIVLLTDVFLRSAGRVGARRSSSREGGGAGVILLIVALVLAILAPLMARLLFLACSRRREYLADASAARFTRYPEGLASALEKIGAAGQGQDVCRNLAPLYIVNPLQAASSSGLLSTHPALEERIRILRGMAGGAGYVDYEAAFRKVRGQAAGCLSPAFLQSQTHVEARAASPVEPTIVAPAREAIDVLDRAADYRVIKCPCGVRLKLPPTWTGESIRCPRCGRSHEAPPAPSEDAQEMTYRRKTRGWESFPCACRQTLQIGPSFSAPFLNCPKCRRRIRIQP